MKKLVFLFALIFALSFSISSVRGGADQVDFPDIYIDSSVGDGGVGSEADPYNDFADINWTTGGDNSIFDYYAGAEAASCTINLQRGERWRETLTQNNIVDGSAAYPIIVQAYGSGDLPKVYGSTEVSTWAVHDGSIYSATYNADPMSVSFVNTDGSVTWGVEEAGGHDDCDAEYEWNWDSNVLYCYAPGDPDTEYTSVEVPTRDYGVYFHGVDYVHVTYLEVAFAVDRNIFTFQTTGLKIDNCVVHHAGNATGGGNDNNIMAYGSNSSTFSNNTVYEGYTGIWFLQATGDSSDDNVVENNIGYNNYHCNFDFHRSSPAASCDNLIVRYNISYRTDAFDATKDTGNDIFVKGNDVGEYVTNVKIHHNILFNLDGSGIYTNDYCDGVEIYNNTIYGLHPSAGHGPGIEVDTVQCENITIKNNIVMDCSVTVGCLYIWGGGDALVAVDYNLWYQSGGGGDIYINYNGANYHFDDFDANNDYQGDTGWETNGLWEDPKLRDPDNMNGRLFAHSPCVDAGVDVSLTRDCDGVKVPHGKAPDIGAHETIPVIIARLKELMKEMQ